jgi:chromatin remodeling complex protein RSC6
MATATSNKRTKAKTVTPKTPEVTPPEVKVEDQTVAEDDSVAPTSNFFDVLNENIVSVLATLKSLQVLAKQYQKEVNKLSKKTAKKKTKGGAEDGAKKSPSGFAKPTRLSENLCLFLGVPLDAEMARTEVTRRLNAYIKENNLQLEEDKRKIRLDDKLKTIMSQDVGDNLTFFNLQSFIKHNFVKGSDQ